MRQGLHIYRVRHPTNVSEPEPFRERERSVLQRLRPKFNLRCAVKVRSTFTNNEVTVWLPLNTDWPVISVSIVDDMTKDLLWSAVHESFTAVAMNGPDVIALNVTRVSTTPPPDAAARQALAEKPLRYGVAPDRMRQTVPNASQPPSLRKGRQYLAVVRETIDDSIRWFEFQVG